VGLSLDLGLRSGPDGRRRGAFPAHDGGLGQCGAPPESESEARLALLSAIGTEPSERRRGLVLTFGVMCAQVRMENSMRSWRTAARLIVLRP
jgi:hypothetical protein